MSDGKELDRCRAVLLRAQIKCESQKRIIAELKAKLAAAEADIQRLVSEAVEREALFQAEREKVWVLREALEFCDSERSMIEITAQMIARKAKEALATTEPEDA